MQRGWQVELIDGTVLEEETSSWKSVPKAKILRLSLLYDGRRWDLSNKEAYFIRNKASVVPGIDSSFKIEQRCIGFYEGSKKINYILNEDTGRFNIEISEG